MTDNRAVEVRCPHCNKLLLKIDLGLAQIEVKCHRCDLIVTWPTMRGEIQAHKNPIPPPKSPVVGRVKLTGGANTAAGIVARLQQADSGVQETEVVETVKAVKEDGKQ